MRVYLSGPMTGIPDFNFPAFEAAAESLRSRRIDVINPSEFEENIDRPWDECLRHDLVVLLSAYPKVDAIVTLPGWERSRGATLEVHVAKQLGIPVVSYGYVCDVFSAADVASKSILRAVVGVSVGV